MSSLTAPTGGLSRPIIQVRSSRPVKTGPSILALSNVNKPKTTYIMKNCTPFTCVDAFAELTGGCGLTGTDSNFVQNENPEPNRKRRLDHLSFDEKLKRKKLKNRVAAQTSRDRKKAQMDKLEAEIKELKDHNRKLAQANSRLQSERERLASENVELREKVSSLARCHDDDNNVQSPSVGCSPLNEGPAVPVAHPLLKGSGLQPAPGLDRRRQQMIHVWRILTFCILSQNSWQISRKTTPVANLKNWQRAYLKKLVWTDQARYLKPMLRRQAHVPLKWWGPHQSTWGPVED